MEVRLVRHIDATGPSEAVSARRAFVRGASVTAIAFSLAVSIPLPNALASARTAQACAPLDTACVAETIGQHVGSAEDTVGEVANDATGAVDDAVGRTSGELERSTDPSTGSDGAGDATPVRGRRGGGGGDGRGDGRGGSRHSGDRVGDRSKRSSTTSRRRTAPSPRRSASSTVATANASARALPATQGSSVDSGDAGIGAAHVIARIGSTLALPLGVLLACLLAFVLMHHRLDRDDPKLRVAELHRDMLRFR
jgi:hypothetical protein